MAPACALECYACKPEPAFGIKRHKRYVLSWFKAVWRAQKYPRRRRCLSRL